MIAGDWQGAEPTAGTEVYDGRKGRFARGPAMTTNRYKHAAVPLAGGAHSSSADRTVATSPAGMRAPSGVPRGPPLP